jgi:tRNA dimethylallyltransferase
MEIGTAKATREQRALVPHRLLDIVDPDQVLSAAEYQALAYAAIDETLARGRLPLLVGGTGQYVRAVLEGWSMPGVPPQPRLRTELEAEAGRLGAAALHARLATLDAAAAARIDYRNVRRVIRALEVCTITGEPISRLQSKKAPPYRILRLGIDRPRAELYARIDERVDAMMAAGLVDEVARLVAAGYGWDLPAMSGLGYKQIGGYLRGESSLAAATDLIKRQTRRFVHQQHTWFRPDDPDICWVDPGRVSLEEILRPARRWLESER